MSISDVLARLSAEGWSLDEQATAAYLKAECGGVPPLPQALQALLDADLKQVGAAALPDDVNRAESKKLAGPLVLQVSSVLDISQPTRASGDSERKGRMLRLRLTDGRSACVGIEFAPLPLSVEQLCPGTKVRLRGASVRVGTLLLEPRCVELLGGRVEQLAGAWETQQKYGGTTVERTDGEADKPPAFRHFDPKLAKYGSRRGEAPAKAAAAAASGSPGGLAGPAGGHAIPAQQQKQQQAQQAQQQQAQPQQQRRGARRGFQPYQPPVARMQQGQQQQQEAAQHASSTQQAAPPGRQEQRQARGRGLPPAQRGAAAAAPPPPPASAPASAAPAAGAAAQQALQAERQQSSAAAQKLLGRLQEEEGRFGRGPRRGRRRRFDDDADDGSLTLEEWEAQRAAAQAAPAGPSQQQLSDEELARQLQRQLDLEAAQEWAANAEAPPNLAASLQSMFTYGGSEEGGRDGGRGGRGRGRRGGGGGGRGRGCSRR